MWNSPIIWSGKRWLPTHVELPVNRWKLSALQKWRKLLGNWDWECMELRKWLNDFSLSLVHKPVCAHCLMDAHMYVLMKQLNQGQWGFHGIWFHVFFQELHRQLAMRWQQTHCRFWSLVTVLFIVMVHWGSTPGAKRTAWRTGYWNMRD